MTSIKEGRAEEAASFTGIVVNGQVDLEDVARKNSSEVEDVKNTKSSVPCRTSLWSACHNCCTIQCWHSIFVSIPLFAVLWAFIVIILISKVSLQFHHLDHGLNDLGIDIGVMVTLFEWMIGLTISGNMVAILIDAVLGTDENVDKLIGTYKLNEGRHCCTWMITKVINVFLTLGFIVAWTNIFCVVILAVISVSMLASIFMSNAVCTTPNLSENQIITVVNNAFAEFHQIVSKYWGESASSINSIDTTTVDGFCRLWQLYQVDLMNNSILSNLAILVQTNIAVACFRRCLLALHRIEMIQMIDSQEKEILDIYERTKMKKSNFIENKRNGYVRRASLENRSR